MGNGEQNGKYYILGFDEGYCCGPFLHSRLATGKTNVEARILRAPFDPIGFA